MARTYQTVDVITGWEVFCLETPNEIICTCQSKAAAIAKCTELNREADEISQDSRDISNGCEFSL